jgi:hypothetical protein
MPYQAKKGNDEHASDQQTETDEQAAENTAHGADLLLSLTKGSNTNPMVTPRDPVGNNTSTESLEGSTKSCDSGMGPPITTTGGFPRNGHQPRMLYHSPIKTNSSSTLSTSKGKLRRSCDSDGISGELAPYIMVPAWSPSLYNGMVYPAHGRSPNYHPPQCNGGPDEKTGKRRVIDMAEKKETEDGSVTAKKQRLISPSSSNEKPEEDSPPEPVPSGTHTSWNIPGPQRTGMFNMPPHWHHPPGYPPPPHIAYPHSLPHYPMYSPYPPPWGMYGPPVTHSAHMLQPPPGSFRRHPSPFKASSTGDNGLKKGDKARHVSCESLRNDSDTSDNTSSCHTYDQSLNRCIPLKQPIPKRSWSYVHIVYNRCFSLNY